MQGCTSNPAPQPYIPDEEPAVQDKRAKLSQEDYAAYITLKDKAVGIEHNTITEQQRREAYKQGVSDVLEDFKGRMRAQEGFVYEPTLIEYVEMPAAVHNGAMYPTHKVPVIVRRGRWIERNGVALPDPEKLNE
jgi:hypothetical protein